MALKAALFPTSTTEEEGVTPTKVRAVGPAAEIVTVLVPLVEAEPRRATTVRVVVPARLPATKVVEGPVAVSRVPRLLLTDQE